MAGALFSAIVERLGSLLSSEFKLAVNVREEVQKLETKFRDIQAVLNDAEKRQLKEEKVKLWVDKLEGVSDEIDNVLDEWNTVMIKAEIEKQQKEFEEEEKAETSTAKKRKVWPLISVPNFLQHRDIAHKLKELHEKFDEIYKEGKMYKFVLRDPKLTEKFVERPKTTSYVDVSEILGRDKVKNDLVSTLLGKGTEKDRHPYVISLVGLGGIGKTSLAQIAYNDQEVQAYFDKRIWICVSEPFDGCRVAKAIIEALSGDEVRVTELQGQLEAICNLIGTKKFFLVFDDVWTEDYAMWKPFKDALKNCGSQSSRILVTTRKEQVAKVMESADTIKLNELSEEDCWSVFSKIAFFDKDPKQREQLEDFGIQISKKCKGLPLAAKTLGSLMRLKESREEWRNVLINNLWELEDVERGLFVPLLLSYYDLSSPLKRCFSYCAVFPKDHLFDVDELVEMWIAHGFVESKGNMEVEIRAREYFENLVLRSFFQECEKDEYWYDMIALSTRYKMHDIVHDFAQSITKAHHLGYSTTSQFPPSADISKHLRTIIFFNQCYYNMSNLVQNFSRLRVLTLTDGMEIPGTIGNLIHLRYLNLTCRRNIYASEKYPLNWELPETICNLCNLQFLRLHWDHISILPQQIGKLINLRLLTGGHLVIPREIGRLTSLRKLDRVLISDQESERCEFEGLKNLNRLRDLSLRSSSPRRPLSPRSDSRSIESELLIFNALEPPQGLEKLRISYYWGTTMLPIWLASLTNLKVLRLDDAMKLMSLPPLGKILPCLESLTIVSAQSLKKVGVEFLGIESENRKEDIKIFPNLKYLAFYYMWEWEEWIGGKEDEDCITIMPRLQKLKICYCRELKSLPDFLRTTPLKELAIKGCPIIMERCRRGTGEYWHNISHIPIIKLADNPYDTTRGSDSEASSDSHTDRERAEDEKDASDFEPEENGSEEEEIDEEDEDEDGGEG